MLKVAPDLAVDELHARVVAGDFDTSRNLKEFPTEKLEGKKIAVIGLRQYRRRGGQAGTRVGMKVLFMRGPGSGVDRIGRF